MPIYKHLQGRGSVFAHTIDQLPVGSENQSLFLWITFFFKNFLFFFANSMFSGDVFILAKIFSRIFHFCFILIFHIRFYIVWSTSKCKLKKKRVGREKEERSWPMYNGDLTKKKIPFKRMFILTKKKIYSLSILELENCN